MRLLPASPVLHLSPTALQVGIREPVVLDGLSPLQMTFVGSLEGGRAIGQGEARRHRRLLDRLSDAGLLERPDQTPIAAPPGTVRFRSAAALAVEAATVLARSGWAIAFDDRDHTRTQGAHVAPGSTRGVHAAQRVREAVPGAHVRGASAAADVDVVVTVGLPVTATRALMSADALHVLVVCDERGVTVGPAVAPGAGPCAVCLGLWASEADDRWPRLALQCETRRPRASALTSGIAGMLVAGAVTTLHGGGTPPTWRVEEAHLEPVPDPSRHPACRCAGPR